MLILWEHGLRIPVAQRQWLDGAERSKAPSRSSSIDRRCDGWWLTCRKCARICWDIPPVAAVTRTMSLAPDLCALLRTADAHPRLFPLRQILPRPRRISGPRAPFCRHDLWSPGPRRRGDVLRGLAAGPSPLHSSPASAALIIHVLRSAPDADVGHDPPSDVPDRRRDAANWYSDLDIRARRMPDSATSTTSRPRKRV